MSRWPALSMSARVTGEAVVGRPGPSEILDRYEVDEALTVPVPTSIAIVDDVLTTGAHFRAACAVLGARFPAAAVIGLFMARRVPGAI